MQGLVATMMGLGMHESERALLQVLWAEMHHELPDAIENTYRDRKRQYYVSLPSSFFKQLVEKGIGWATPENISRASPPVVGHGAVEDDEEEDVPSEDEDDDLAERLHEEEPGYEATEQRPMTAAERAHAQHVMNELRSRVLQNRVEKESEKQARPIDAEHAFEECRSSGVLPYYKRNMLLKGLNERYAAHLVDETTAEKAFRLASEFIHPFLVCAQAYRAGNLDATTVQAELSLHAQTPSAWCKDFLRRGLYPRSVHQSADDSRRVTILLGLVDPPAEDVGLIEEENFQTATRQDMCGITGDFMRLVVDFVLLDENCSMTPAAVVDIKQFEASASPLLFILNARLEESQ